jgi:hypothetical protein
MFDRCALEPGGAPDRFDLVGRQQFAEDEHLKDVGAVRRTSRQC